MDNEDFEFDDELDRSWWEKEICNSPYDTRLENDVKNVEVKRTEDGLEWKTE